MRNIKKTQYCLTLKLNISATTKKTITSYKKQMEGKRLNSKPGDRHFKNIKISGIFQNLKIEIYFFLVFKLRFSKCLTPIK